jgi:hypothetical protein
MTDAGSEPERRWRPPLVKRLWTNLTGSDGETPIPPVERMAVLVLEQYCPAGFTCAPTNEDLAIALDRSHRAVQHILGKMEENGVIRRVFGPGPPKGKTRRVAIILLKRFTASAPVASAAEADAEADRLSAAADFEWAEAMRAIRAAREEEARRLAALKRRPSRRVARRPSRRDLLP